ncbi:hypothetical protein VTK73DRAFT_5262 [Phialemonium thermophilum]|uniref:BHLH domain-containing protein n=1 Tax=Phialemonium thermophilum TaxID=223376 RepID=A0ABR3WPF6_9PEZI
MPSREGDLPPAGRSSSADPVIPTGGQQQPPKRPQKKRVRNFTADDRAAHAVFERSRREAFKERLTELARLLPALAGTDPSRLSKHVVLEESIARHKTQDTNRLAAIQHIQALTQERDELLLEVNEWRARCGGGFLSPRQALVGNDAISDFLNPDTSQSRSQRAQSSSGQSVTDAEQERDATTFATDSQNTFMDHGLAPEPPLHPIDSGILPTQVPWTGALDAIPADHEPFGDLAAQVPEPFAEPPGPAPGPPIFPLPDHHASLPDITVGLLPHDDLFGNPVSPGLSAPSSFIPQITPINHMAPNSDYIYQ